jgi:hypothetical protein
MPAVKYPEVADPAFVRFVTETVCHAADWVQAKSDALAADDPRRQSLAVASFKLGEAVGLIRKAFP